VHKARQVYLYSTFHTQWQFKVLYIEEIKIIKRIMKNKNYDRNKIQYKNNMTPSEYEGSFMHVCDNCHEVSFTQL